MLTAIENDISQMPTVYDYPHLISLLVVVVAVTCSVSIWSARKRGELKGKGNILSLIFFFIMIVLTVSILYLLPALILIWLIKFCLMGLRLSPVTFVSELVETAIRIAVLICLLDNCADVWSVGKRVSLGVHYLQFFIFIFPSYYGIMCISWLLARVIAAGGGFDPVYVQAADSLFSVPMIHADPTFNTVFIFSFICLAALISYGLRVSRARRYI